MRRLAIAAALVGALTLTGCTEIGAIGEQTGIDIALGGLVSDLEADYGVTAVTAKSMDAEYQFTATVTIAADELSRDVRGPVITAVDEVLGSSAFANATVWFTVGDDLNPVYTQSVFGLDSLTDDLAYWAAVEAAVGEVSFTISEVPEGTGSFTRWRGVYSAGPIDYAQLADLELDDTALDSWGSLGVSAAGSLPSADAADLLAELTATLPLRDWADPEQPRSIALDWSAEPATAVWTFTSSSLLDDAIDPVGSTDWPIAVDVFSRIADAGIPNSSFAYFNSANVGPIVWIGDCAGTTQASEPDSALVEALQSAGAVMPAGSAPGWCSGG